MKKRITETLRRMSVTKTQREKRDSARMNEEGDKEDPTRYTGSCILLKISSVLHYRSIVYILLKI